MNSPDRYAVIGHPIAHSLSPSIHQAFARQTSQALTYAAIDVDEGDFHAFWLTPAGRELAGANITLPHKTAAFALVDEHSSAALACAAVNTISRLPNGRLHGDNSDGIGLLRDLTKLAMPVAGRRLLVVGAGGAARGILPALLAAKPQQVVLANRTLARAVDLAAAMGKQVQAVSLAALINQSPFDGIINASAAGHGTGLALPATLVAPSGWCYDLSYGEAAQGFCAWARQHCHRTHDGLGMLVEQAAVSFALWRGVEPLVQPVLQSLRRNFSGP